jgi:hypothetical protein
MSFFSDFGFRGTYAELREKYPNASFHISDINGEVPKYSLSHYPPGTRAISLKTLTPEAPPMPSPEESSLDTGSWTSLMCYLHTHPERLQVVSIGVM